MPEAEEGKLADQSLRALLLWPITSDVACELDADSSGGQPGSPDRMLRLRSALRDYRPCVGFYLSP